MLIRSSSGVSLANLSAKVGVSFGVFIVVEVIGVPEPDVSAVSELLAALPLLGLAVDGDLELVIGMLLFELSDGVGDVLLGDVELFATGPGFCLESGVGWLLAVSTSKLGEPGGDLEAVFEESLA